MMIKKVLTAFLTVFTLFFMTSCQLAKEENNQTSKQSRSDKLVGAFITSEIYQSGRHIDARLTTVTNTDPATGKVSAVMEYVFESIKGITFIAAEIPHTDTEDSFLSTGSDEAVCDRHLSVNVGDNEGIDLKGSVYISTEAADRYYFFNPVYQREDGSVYAVQGASDAYYLGGGSLAQHLNETNTITENGKTKSVHFNADISIAAMNPPSNIIVLQMDKDSTILSKQAYTPGKLPYNITPDAGTSYIIVETHKLDVEGKPAVSYEIYNKGSEPIKSFYCREDGICIQKLTVVNWSKQ